MRQYNLPTRNLTARQAQACLLRLSGLSVKEVAHHMNISISTVECHLASAYIKLDVHNVMQLAAKMPEVASAAGEPERLMTQAS
jgi:DNA-binding NarL/FixJ family response regulator